VIEDLDKALRELLIRELPIKNGEIDIAFDQPSREWSARIGGRPTLNLFLYDARENRKLRQTRPVWETVSNPDGTVTQRRRPVRMDLHYMITAWATEAEDEHRLLASTLMALFRQPHLPEDLLPESLRDQPVPIPLEVAQSDELQNPADVWNVLDNEIRAAIALTVTLALNPYQPITGPLVRTRELRFGQSGEPPAGRLDEGSAEETYWTVGGVVQSDGQPLMGARVLLVEQGREVPVEEDGRFAIGHLRAGEYTLAVSMDGSEPQYRKIAVPAPDYDLDLGT
jgi:hypothetical protein